MTTQTISTLHTESEAQDSWVPMVAIAFVVGLLSADDLCGDGHSEPWKLRRRVECKSLGSARR